MVIMLLVICAICLICGPARATTVTGKVADAAGNPVPGATVNFALINIGRGNIALESGTSIVAPALVTATSGTNGAFSIALVGNDAITPNGTLYQVVIRGAGITYGPFVYSITGATADLDSLVPVATFPNTASQVAAAQLVPPSGCAANQVLQWTGTAWMCAASASGATLETNGTSNAVQSTLNFQTSTANAAGLTLTPTYQTGGGEKFEITGNSYTGNAATATALAAMPAQCTTNQFATGIATNGAANCLQPGFANLSGQATAAQLPATINASAIYDKGGQVYNAKAYGAKGNGVLIYNCSTTTASPNITCSTAAFAAADAGKAFQMQDNNGTNLVTTTILSVTDATHVVLAANATSTSSAMNVVYGTDDTAAIRSLITIVIAAGGGKIFVPPGIYILNGTPSTFNALLDIPGVALNAPYKTIQFEGAAIPLQVGAGGAPYASTGAFYAMSPIVAGGAVLLADPYSSSYSSVNVVVENLLFVTPINPNYSVVRLDYAYDQTVQNCSVIANKAPNGSLPIGPTSSQGVGFEFGGYGGQGLNANLYVQGIYTGFQLNDHSVCISCYAQNVFRGFLSQGGSHTREIYNGLVQDAVRGLELDGATHIFAQVDFETNTYDIYTDGTAMKGFIYANNPNAAIGAIPTSPGLVIQDANAPGLILPTQTLNPNGAVTTLNGTTAGTLKWSQPMQGTALKKAVLNFQGFENTTATPQTVTFPTAFAYAPSVVGCTLPAGITVTATQMSAVSMGATFTAQCMVEGQ